MKSCLILTTRAFSSDFKSLFEQMQFLNEEYDNIYLIHMYKTDRIEKFLKETMNINITQSFNIHKFFRSVTKGKYPTWDKVMDDFDVSQFPKVDDIWLFGAPLSDGGALKRRKNYLIRNSKRHSFIKFISVAKLYLTSYVIMKIVKEFGAQYKEMCYDPGEASLPIDNKIVYHGYDSQQLGFKKHNSYQTGLKYYYDNEEIDKEYDIVFGYSRMNSERDVFHDRLEKTIIPSLDNQLKVRFMCKNKEAQTDTLVSKEEYMELLKRSKFTFIINAYQTGAFSIYRLLEAVYFNCVPLIHEDCPVAEVYASYDLNPSIMGHLIFNDDNVLDVYKSLQSKRTVILSYLKNKLGLTHE